jgi:hypothetical protein
VLTEEFQEQSSYKRCFSRRSKVALPTASFSSSWCRRRSAVGGLRQHRSGGDDWTHSIELHPRLASQQQEKQEARFSVALGQPGVRAVRPNHLAQGERQRRATRARCQVRCTFSVTGPWHHTVGTSLSSNVRRRTRHPWCTIAKHPLRRLWHACGLAGF